MEPILKWFEDFKFIAVIRSSSADDADAMIKAAMDGGFKIFEVSMQTSQAVKLLENYTKRDDCIFGATSVTDGEIAQRAINAGAKFVSTPYTNRDVITVAKHNDTIVIQGALTPTEAITAQQYGADMVLIYPISLMGGPTYLKSLRGALPSLKLIAGGGVSLENAFVYLKDCVAVGIGRALFDRTLLRADNWTEITERAKQLTQKIETLKVSKS